MNELTPGGEGREEERQYADSLRALGSALARAAGPVEQAGGAHTERVLDLLGAAHEALRTAAERFTAPASRPPTGDAAAVRAWLHELRTPGTAMVGWAQMLALVQDAPGRLRATQAIERNAERLIRLLSQPPP